MVLLDFIKLLRIPVVTSPNGKGTIDERHELSFGPMGRNGPYAANEATRNADVILGLGCSFDDRATSAWISGYTLTIPPTKLIQIDNDPSEIGRNYPAHLGILGDIRAWCQALPAPLGDQLAWRNAARLMGVSEVPFRGD